MKLVFRFLVFVVATALLVIASNWYYFVGADTSQETKDVNYMIELGLMKGHLLVGKELLDSGYLQQAEVHIGQPVTEIYENLQQEFSDRHVWEFKKILINLQGLVRTDASVDRVENEFEIAMLNIDRAIAVLPFRQRLTPQFLVKVVNGLLENAGAEYKGAIADGKIVRTIDYQDARGFAIYAETIYNRLSEPMGTTYPDIHRTIVASIQQLNRAWPRAIAPENALMTPEQVSQLIETIHESSKKL